MSFYRLTLRFRVDRAVVRWGLVLLAMAGAAPELSSESVTMTTYFPNPTASYTQLIATGDAYIARDAGRLRVGSTAAPAYTVDVTGDLRASNLISTAGYARVTAGANARQTGCTSVVWAGTTAGTCGANRYATYVPGVLYPFASGIQPRNDGITRVYCCDCPTVSTGACPR